MLGDDPIDGRDDDRFSRGQFASRVVEVLDAIADGSESGVVAIVGPWGSGKTSLLNLVQARLKEGEAWSYGAFNPWMVADLPSLVREFFSTLMSGILDDETDRDLRSRLSNYAAAAAPFGSIFKLAGVDAEKGLEAISAALAGDKTLEAKRAEVVEALRQRTQPLLVIVDDLDRLHPTELLLALKLFRLVGRLPNTFYLLAFDESTVLDVLSATELAAGSQKRASDYLEKMIQVRLELPPAHPLESQSMLDELLESLISRFDVEFVEDDQQRLASAYRRHMASQLQEPRAIKRYCAHLEALYPVVRDEVNFVDFALITFLSVEHPGLTAELRKHKAELTATSFRLKRETPEEQAEHYRALVAASGVPAEDQKGVLEVLSHLFIPVRGALESTTYSGGSYDRAAEARRVASSEYFDRYFHLGIGPDDLSDATVVQAVQEITTEDHGAAVVELEARLPKAPDLISKLIRMAPVGPDSAGPLLLWLLKVRDELPRSALGVSAVQARIWMKRLFRAANPVDPDRFILALEDAGAHLVELAWLAVRTTRSEDQEGPEPPLAAPVMRRAEEEVERLLGGSVAEASSIVSLALAVSEWRGGDTDDKPLWPPVAEGRWDLTDLLALFVGTQRWRGSGGVRVELGDVSVDEIDRLVGLDRAVEVVPDSELEVEDKEDLSWDARRNRVLRVLQHHFANRSQADAG